MIYFYDHFSATKLSQFVVAQNDDSPSTVNSLYAHNLVPAIDFFQLLGDLKRAIRTVVINHNNFKVGVTA